MERIRIEDIETPATNSPADVLRPLSPALGVTGVAINYFELAPEESFGNAYHRHNDQEEVFYIQSGTATFETEDGDVEVGQGELIRFAPGEFQLGTNRKDERVSALALGSPRDSEEVEYKIECAECGEKTVHTSDVDIERELVVIECSECGNEIEQSVSE